MVRRESVSNTARAYEAAQGVSCRRIDSGKSLSRFQNLQKKKKKKKKKKKAGLVRLEASATAPLPIFLAHTHSTAFRQENAQLRCPQSDKRAWLQQRHFAPDFPGAVASYCTLLSNDFVPECNRLLSDIRLSSGLSCFRQRAVGRSIDAQARLRSTKGAQIKNVLVDSPSSSWHCALRLALR